MPNHLAQETSPYLQQHADNPVDWYAWHPDTLRLAREQDKPILLSIGYSACLWCHVMAHESFEDPDVAAVMNKHFINIKVDREERPDLDQIYQTAHHMLTQRNGGWPLTMFLSPDGTPFFGGTYFPKQARYNLPAFPDLLQRVAQVYAENRAELAAQGQHLIAALAETLPKPGSSEVLLNDSPLALAVRQHSENFDNVNGGFGGAPKFLHPAELDLLLRRSHATRDKQVLHIVHHTLQQMAHGGLYDQLGGGFCRYSVDERWDIPHFEKMLYDNGLLLCLYCDAWQSSGDPMFVRIVEQTAAWVLREMQSPDVHGTNTSADDEACHTRLPHPNPLPLAGEGWGEGDGYGRLHHLRWYLCHARPGIAFRAAPRRRSVRRCVQTSDRRCSATRRNTGRAAGRCHKAFFRSAECPSVRPRCSGKNRRRVGHTVRRAPSVAACDARCAAPACRGLHGCGAAANRVPQDAGISARRRSRHSRCRSFRCVAAPPAQAK